MKGGEEYSHTSVGRRPEAGARFTEAVFTRCRESDRDFQSIPQPIRERPDQETFTVFPSQARDALWHRLRAANGGGRVCGAQGQGSNKPPNAGGCSACQERKAIPKRGRA